MRRWSWPQPTLSRQCRRGRGALKLERRLNPGTLFWTSTSSGRQISGYDANVSNFLAFKGKFAGGITPVRYVSLEKYAQTARGPQPHRHHWQTAGDSEGRLLCTTYTKTPDDAAAATGRHSATFVPRSQTWSPVFDTKLPFGAARTAEPGDRSR